MTCRQAFDIDMAAFLLGPRADEWVSFRSHYPQCPTCAAEVRVWTELTAFLEREGPGDTPGSPHPAAEMLLLFAENRASLSAAEARRIEHHVGLCVSCRDEIAALDRFAGGGLVGGRVPESSAGRRGAWWRDALASAGRMVLHPAFAYGLLLIVLVPALLERMSSAPATLAGGERGARLPQVEAPVSGRSQPVGDYGQLDSREVARAPIEERRGGVPSPARPTVQRMNREPPPAAAEMEGAPERSVSLASRADDAAGPGAVVAVPRGRTFAVEVPLPDVPAPERTVEVRVAQRDDARELRERVTAAAGADHVTIRIPKEWLVEESYQVELWSLDSAGNATGRLGSFPLRVR